MIILIFENMLENLYYGISSLYRGFCFLPIKIYTALFACYIDRPTVLETGLTIKQGMDNSDREKDQETREPRVGGKV